MWPERGKTGVARLALTSGATVVPVALWGAHEVLPYAAPKGLLGALGRALVRRPVVRVHFGTPVDLSGLSAGGPATRCGPPSGSSTRSRRRWCRCGPTSRIVGATSTRPGRSTPHAPTPAGDLTRLTVFGGGCGA